MPWILDYLSAHQSRRRKLHTVLVYIAEAHAADTWPMKFTVEWSTPKDLSERLRYAEACRAGLCIPDSIPIVADGMANAFNGAYAAWPMCYYVISPDKRLVYIGDSPDHSSAAYDVNQLFAFLDTELSGAP